MGVIWAIFKLNFPPAWQVEAMCIISFFLGSLRFF